MTLKPVTDEHVFYDKFSYEKYFTMLAFQQVHLSKKIGKVQILFVCIRVNKENLAK